MKINVFLIAIIVIAANMSSIMAQVTVGSTEKAVEGALLQVKTVDDDVSAGGYNAEKGIALPRVALVSDTLLSPMYETDAAKSLIHEIKSGHKSLTVFNVTTDEDNNLSEGIYYWDSVKWVPIQKGTQKALFEIDCSSAQVRGSYGNGVPVDNSNYIRIGSINVTREGSYSIVATSEPDNGYFFELSGNFYSGGSYSLSIPAMGSPTNAQTDRFTLKASGGQDKCELDITVRDMTTPRNFTIDCNSTVIEGKYFEDQPLNTVMENGPHRIKVTLSVDPDAVGSTADLQTDEVDGIYFKGSALLTQTPKQEVYLTGFGTPRGLNDKIFTITCNSDKSTASCNANLYMLIPRKRLMTLGNITQPLYAYNAGIVDTKSPKSNLNTMLTDKDNFGYNQWSIVKFQGFNNMGTAWDANFVPSASINDWKDDDRDIIAFSTETWHNISASKLENILMGYDGNARIDIFMIGYDTEFFRDANSEDIARCKKLVDFVKSGGILMICSEQQISNANFMNMLFEYPAIKIESSGGGGAGSRYTFGFDISNMDSEMKPYFCRDDDPILRGPFGDIVGRHWGEDASQTKFILNLPLDDIVIYSGARFLKDMGLNPKGVTVFRHRELPFVFIGDGGFNSSENRTHWDVTDSACPFVLKTKVINGRIYNNYPDYRLNFFASGNRVYNALFTANAFAWCIYRAEEYRRFHR
ncbi:MAG: hypothetical protein LBS54_08460 [Dysgonamonadaceae bacterium]|jgi:hypothetical protein|nr:hypothetical protein [Dysgonamonadaceae bacterium]